MIRLARGKKYIHEVATKQTIFSHNKNIKKALEDYGAEIIVDLKTVIETGTRSGRVYFRKGIAHTASAPGEPPASQTGKLAESFGYKARKYELLVYSTAFANNGFPYPRYLEEGTKKMEPRPYWEITHKNNAYKLQKELQSYGI